MIPVVLLCVAALAGGCQAPIDAYYNANENIVARRLFYNDERHIAVDADGPLSRPSVARYDGATWVAWRHNFRRPSGDVVRGIGIGAAPCLFSEAVIFDELDSERLSTPGLAVHGGRLVLAWCRDDTLVLRTSPDGITWSEAATLRVGPLPHVSLAEHGGRLYAAGPRPVAGGEGGTVTLYPVGDDFTWGEPVDVIAHPRLDPARGVSLASSDAALFVAYAIRGSGVAMSHSATGEDGWVHEEAFLDEHRLQQAVLVPGLQWDRSKDRLRAAWTDGASLWIAEQRSGSGWTVPVCADVYTPSLRSPAGAALLVQ